MNKRKKEKGKGETRRGPALWLIRFDMTGSGVDPV
jgi:hypothetical protein